MFDPGLNKEMMLLVDPKLSPPEILETLESNLKLLTPIIILSSLLPYPHFPYELTNQPSTTF